MDKKEKVRIETTINANLNKVWDFWTTPEHIMKWNNASEDWHTTKAENNLKVEGKFIYRMEAKDGSMGFDFGGTYTKVDENQCIECSLDDGRKVRVEFSEENDMTKVVEFFESEKVNPVEMQKSGWQSILNNFKRYVESN